MSCERIPYQPRRNDSIEFWLTFWRGQIGCEYGTTSDAYQSVDRILENYRMAGNLGLDLKDVLRADVTLS